MKHDPDLSLTAMFVQMQKTILQLSARVEALEAANRALCLKAMDVDSVRITPGPSARERLTMALICEKVATAHGVTIDQMKAKRGPDVIAEARAEFCRLACGRGFSTTAVGRFLGGRDHTTIMQLRDRALKAVAQ